MAGRMNLPNVSVESLRHQSAMITLRKVRKQGHEYVEIRQDGKRYIFLCVLCRAMCYDDNTLFDHLDGRRHKVKLAAAEATLLKPNPWPFNDGVFFFRNSENNDGNEDDNSARCDDDLVIPGVLRGDKMDSLEVKLIGVGEIGARILEKGEGHEQMTRIWCAWLGKKDDKDEDFAFMLRRHDYAVVTFSYDYNLGRMPVVIDLDQYLALNASVLVDSGEGQTKRRKKSLSEPGDISKSLSEQGSSLEDFHSIDRSTSEMMSQLRHSKSTMKRIRQEMREQQYLACQRVCDICHITLLPGKDVASLLNLETGKLACSSRNPTGAFHLFHISCLVHWILFCEHEIWSSLLAKQEARCRPKMKRGGRRGAKQMVDKRAMLKPVSSIFCPECQGTGSNVEDRFEKPSYLLSEMFTYMIKAKDAHRAWMNSPEDLQHCSMGLHFPNQSTEPVQERVSRLKLLHFYRAEVHN